MRKREWKHLTSTSEIEGIGSVEQVGFITTAGVVAVFNGHCETWGKKKKAEHPHTRTKIQTEVAALVVKGL